MFCFLSSQGEQVLNFDAIHSEDQSAIGTQMKSIEDDCKGLNINMPKQLHQLRDDLLKTIEIQSYSESEERASLKQQLQDIQSLLTTIPIHHRVLRQLISDDMGSRWNQIHDGQPDTCRWILGDGLDDPKDLEGGSDSDSDSSEPSVARDESSDWEAESINRRETRGDFIHWLTTGQDVLHISGNAGSGKSTLMKFVGQHRKTKKELQTWAGNKRLIFGQFYFWSAGTESQRTLSGLCKSLLFQTLSQCPELIDQVFPQQIARMKSSGLQSDSTFEKFQSFDNVQIRDAFELLLKQTQHSHLRICFLLDGLDELEGTRLEHEDLAIRLRSWTTNGDVKLLVSSRPWPEFLDAFSTNSTIHLHELNRFDIKTYCLGSLAKDRAVRQLGHDQVALELQGVVESIIDQSQGIFLWAHLVLDAVLQGIRQSDPISTLKAKVQEYPTDLDSLYSKLREPVERSVIDKDRSNRMLLLAAKKPHAFRLTTMAVSWILDDNKHSLLDPDFPTEDKCRPYSGREIAHRLQAVTKQMNGLTRGILEISQRREIMNLLDPLIASFGSQEIQFSHRTARDYLVLNESRYQQSCASWPGFDSTDVYGRIHLACFLYGARLSDSVLNDGGDFDSYLHTVEHPYCLSFDFRTIRMFEAPLQPLLRGRSLSQPIRGSSVTFLQWCAYCGLDEFVLSELSANPGKNAHSPRSNIIIPAAHSSRRQETLLLQLLHCGIDIDNMVEVWNANQTFALPAWVVVYHAVFRRRIAESPFKGEVFFTEYDVEVLRFLHDHSGQVGQEISLRLQATTLEDTKAVDHPYTVKRFSSADILQKAEQEAAKTLEFLATSNAADFDESSNCTRNGHDPTRKEIKLTIGEWVDEDSAIPGRRHLKVDVLKFHWSSDHADVPKSANEFDFERINYRMY